MAADHAELVADPSGSVLWRTGDRSEELKLDLRLADIKQFNPNTDLWAQRRVECFRLGGGCSSL